MPSAAFERSMGRSRVPNAIDAREIGIASTPAISAPFSPLESKSHVSQETSSASPQPTSA
jgi:hypothetical protein